VSEEKQVANRPRKARTQQVNEGNWAKRHRVFNEKILGKIVDDLHFREALLTDPQSALRSAGLEDELRELEQHDTVSARDCDSSCLGTCQASCKTFTCIFTFSC
jgi:hypothetical protein